MICPYYADPSLLFFAEGVPYLVYYSHLSSIIVSIIVGFFIYFNNRNSLANKILFVVSCLFICWTTLGLILWTNNQSGLIAFAWSLSGILYSILCIATLYFFLVFTRKNTDVSYLVKSIWLLLLLPTILLTPTTLNIQSFNLIECGAVENITFVYYYYALGLVCFFWVLFSGIKNIRRSNTGEYKFNIAALIGVELFLFAFFFNGFIASYLYDKGLIVDYTIDQFGLFGMTAFMVVLTYMIVKFKAFNIKLIGAQALVVGLVVLVGSQLFFVDTLTTRILVSSTLIFTILGGFFLVKSVKKEIEQRQELELLTQALEKANARLKELDKAKSEFVSIASHQLRSPLTSIRGYASMLVEGSFGKLPTKALEAAARIEESSKLMVLSVEDYLNVSRIESGNMKYNLSDFNVKEMTEHICEDMRPEAMKKGLVLLFRSDLSGQGMVNADVGKTNQIIQNLLNNSLKYTPKGSINVFVRDDIDKKRIYVSITDTGIGMSQATAHTLFQKFSRADNANSVNVSGTGLGLYVALKMAEQMGGTISCQSEGDGKGSTFTFELPLAM
jgi:signal transduction histidine kinase